ncbi:AAA family ATPase [Ascidiaceihabitans sp.]|uniref:ParA family protein n=1 Tax=Ascidiaceihabitans sp. TaxID=1872644 RepID=UPI003296CC50
MSKRIAFFNHKGGVGKTMNAFNVGWKLTEMGYRVLLVDGDSQVNLTAMTLGFDRFDEFYEHEATKKNNIKDGVSPAFDGKPTSIEGFDPPTANHNNSLFILPGHADLASYEGQLSLAQETGGSLSVLKNLPGALNALIASIEDQTQIDFTIIDLNPGLGALNQNLFLACDSFLVPTNPDPFSLMAVGTLGDHVVKWTNWKRNQGQMFSDSDYPMRECTTRFMGTINSRFNKHASKAAKKFDDRIRAIDTRVFEQLFPKLQKAKMVFTEQCYSRAFKLGKDTFGNYDEAKYALARIPDFQSLVHSATNAGKPIFAVNASELRADGLGGVVLDKALDNRIVFNDIYSILGKKVELLLEDECGV